MVRIACAGANRTRHEANLRPFGFTFGEVLPEKGILKRNEMIEIAIENGISYLLR